MTNPESVTLDWALTDLPVGASARVVAVDQRQGAALACHGIRPGVVIEIEDDAPFRGPRIIRIGAARLAIARDVARTIHVVREVTADMATPVR